MIFSLEVQCIVSAIDFSNCVKKLKNLFKISCKSETLNWFVQTGYCAAKKHRKRMSDLKSAPTK